MTKLEEKILKLEQELGLTPLARQRLGIAYGEAQMGFKQLQQLLQEDDERSGIMVFAEFPPRILTER